MHPLQNREKIVWVNGVGAGNRLPIVLKGLSDAHYKNVFLIISCVKQAWKKNSLFYMDKTIGAVYQIDRQAVQKPNEI